MRLADNIDLQAGRQAAHNPFCHMFVVSAFTQHTTVWILLFPFIFIKKIAVFWGAFYLGVKRDPPQRFPVEKEISVWGK